jgi:hypothetical protein
MREEAQERRRRSRERRGRRRGRKSKGTAETADETEVADEAAARSVTLPKSSSKTVLTGVGVVAGLVAAWLAAAGIPFWLVPAGVALAVTTLALAGTGPAISEIRGDANASTVVLVLEGGAQEIALARSSVAGVRRTTHTSTSSTGSGTSRSYGVALERVDKGMLTLDQSSSKPRAEALVEEIEGLLASVPVDAEAESASVEQAYRRLQDSAVVEVHSSEASSGYRDAGQATLALSWSLADARRLWVLPLALGGMAMMLLGMIAPGQPWIPFAILALLVVLSIGRHFQMRTRRQHVLVNDSHLVIRQTQGEATVDERALPLVSIQALDVPQQGSLSLRVDEANDEIQRMQDAVQERRRVGLAFLPMVLRGVVALVKQTVTVDTGALTFVDRVDVEQVLAAEVAARSDRAAGEL